MSSIMVVAGGPGSMCAVSQSVSPSCPSGGISRDFLAGTWAAAATVQYCLLLLVTYHVLAAGGSTHSLRGARQNADRC